MLRSIERTKDLHFQSLPLMYFVFIKFSRESLHQISHINLLCNVLHRIEKLTQKDWLTTQKPTLDSARPHVADASRSHPVHNINQRKRDYGVGLSQGLYSSPSKTLKGCPRTAYACLSSLR